MGRTAVVAAGIVAAPDGRAGGGTALPARGATQLAERGGANAAGRGDALAWRVGRTSSSSPGQHRRPQARVRTRVIDVENAPQPGNGASCRRNIRRRPCWCSAGDGRPSTVFLRVTVRRWFCNTIAARANLRAAADHAANRGRELRFRYAQAGRPACICSSALPGGGHPGYSVTNRTVRDSRPSP